MSSMPAIGLATIAFLEGIITVLSIQQLGIVGLAIPIGTSLGAVAIWYFEHEERLMEATR